MFKLLLLLLLLIFLFEIGVFERLFSFCLFFFLKSTVITSMPLLSLNCLLLLKKFSFFVLRIFEGLEFSLFFLLFVLLFVLLFIFIFFILLLSLLDKSNELLFILLNELLLLSLLTF